jgi:hypothetical protein
LTNLFSFVTLTGDVEASQEVTAFQFRVSKRGVRDGGRGGALMKRQRKIVTKKDAVKKKFKPTKEC